MQVEEISGEIISKVSKSLIEQDIVSLTVEFEYDHFLFFKNNDGEVRYIKGKREEYAVLQSLVRGGKAGEKVTGLEEDEHSPTTENVPVEVEDKIQESEEERKKDSETNESKRFSSIKEAKENIKEQENSDTSVFECFPKIWETDQIKFDEKDANTYLAKSAYIARRRQYLTFYKDFQTAGLGKIFASYFFFTSLNLAETKSFFWHKKIGTLHYLFLAKNFHPKLTPITDYFHLVSYINNQNDITKPNHKKFYKELQEIIRNLVFVFDETSKENSEDYLGVFCVDEETLKFSYSCNGFYFSSVRRGSKSIVMERFNHGKMPQHGDYSMKRGEKYFIFSEEIFDLLDGDYSEKVKTLKEKFVMYANNEVDLKKLFESRSHDLQSKNKKIPDSLIFYAEVKPSLN